MKTLSEQNLRPTVPQGGSMPTTHWQMIVQAAQSDSPQTRQALEALCSAYWYPLYAFLRRSGHASHEAQDLTQGFFAHLLSSYGLRGVTPKEAMRFRSWLLSSLR